MTNYINKPPYKEEEIEYNETSFMDKKLSTLTKLEGYEDPLELIQAYALDSKCPAICMNEECDYTAFMEPDQEEGWCDECKTTTVVSALVLAGY